MPLSRFEACWLAEAVRLQELSEGRLALESAAPDPLAPGAGREDEQVWLLHRAEQIARAKGLLTCARSWRQRAGLVLIVFAALVSMGGFSATLGLFGAENRAVNVVWTLFGLIGLNFMALVFWLFMLLTGGRVNGGAGGHLWLWLAEHWPHMGVPEDANAAGWVSRALATMMNRSRLGAWWLSAVTHSLWLLALASSLLAILLVLSLRSYGFVLETTILPTELFRQVVTGFAWLPAQFGFAVPDADMIASALTGDIASQSDAARHAWSSWLIGSVLFYAFLPRLLVWLLSVVRVLILRTHLRLDTSLPGFADLLRQEARPRMACIVDAAPPMPASQHIAPLHRVKGRQALLLGLELGRDLPWPPLQRSGGKQLFEIGDNVETREQRRSSVSHCRLNPPSRILVACDARMSPDRGTLAWIIELSQYAGEIRVWLLSPQALAGDRLQVWQESLTGIGLSLEQIVSGESSALDWLNHHD